MWTKTPTQILWEAAQELRYTETYRWKAAEQLRTKTPTQTFWDPARSTCTHTSHVLLKFGGSMPDDNKQDEAHEPECSHVWVQISKHMVMQSRTIPFCNSWFEQSCTCFPCYPSAVWSGKCRVWSVECEVRSVECKVWSGECRVCKV